MTVKRGKYVKEVIEYLFDNGPQTLEAIYLQSSAISEDYVKNAVLNRLLEEAELFYDKDTKQYRLAASVKPTWPRETLGSKAFALGMEKLAEDQAEWRQTAMMPTEEPFLADDFPVAPAKRDKPSQWDVPKAPTVVRTEGKMPRHKETEFVLSVAWLQDMTDIDSAVAHYCDTHLAKSEVITLKDKKIGGERLDFHSVKEEK